jgi:hypothetical protein
LTWATFLFTKSLFWIFKLTNKLKLVEKLIHKLHSVHSIKYRSNNFYRAWNVSGKRRDDTTTWKWVVLKSGLLRHLLVETQMLVWKANKASNIIVVSREISVVHFKMTAHNKLFQTADLLTTETITKQNYKLWQAILERIYHDVEVVW